MSSGIGIFAASTTLPPEISSVADDLTLALTLPLVFFGTALILVTCCVIWHSRAASTSTFTDSTAQNTPSDRSSVRRSFVEVFSRFSKNETRGSVRSDAPLHEQAIPNDFIPPSHHQKRIATPVPRPSFTKKRRAQVQPTVASIHVDTKSTITESEQYEPELSTVTEESNTTSNMSKSDNYMEKYGHQTQLQAFHLSQWLFANVDPSKRILDTREVRSDPNIVFGQMTSICESSDPSTLPTMPNYNDYSITSSVTSGSVNAGPQIHKSPFHPNHNSPINGNSYDLDQMRQIDLDRMRHAITREGAPDAMAEYKSDYSGAPSSNYSNVTSSNGNIEPIPITYPKGIARYLEPEFQRQARRQSSYGSSTYKVESSNETMILYESGTRAPPASLKGSYNSGSFLSSQNSTQLPQQPELRRIVAAYNELSTRYNPRDRYGEIDASGLILVSADNSMHPQVGSSNTTRDQSRPEWDRRSRKSSVSSNDTQMLAGGPLPLRPPAARRKHERSFNSDSDQSIARKRPRASSVEKIVVRPRASSVEKIVVEPYDNVLTKKRSFSDMTNPEQYHTPTSEHLSFEWDNNFHSSHVFGPPLLNSTDLSQLRQQAQGLPVLARKQWWV